MALVYVVRQGDHLSFIAARYGFRDYRTIWNDVSNSDLREQRNPNVLFPGDVVTVPDKQAKSESRPTGAVHTFQVPAPTLHLRIVLEDLSERPLGNLDCELQVEGVSRQLKTDKSGLLDTLIQPTDINGAVKFQGRQIPVQIGFLDPVDKRSGQIARLANLGYYRQSVDDIDEDELKSAIQEFQCDHGLNKSGVCDDPTRTRLQDLHGS